MEQIFNNIYNKIFANKKDRGYVIAITSIIGIITNLVLFSTKLFAGLALNSISVISDSFNNLSDSLSAIISLAVVKASSVPADKEHPFGHKRVEYIASLIIAFIIILVGKEFVVSSVKKITSNDGVSYSSVTMALLIFAVIAKILLYKMYTVFGKKAESSMLELAGKDSLNDVYITATTVFSILFTKYTGIIIDGYLGLAVSLYIIFSGVMLINETISPLLGEAVDNEVASKIKKFVEAYDGVLGTHDLIVHNYGPNVNFCTLHLEVDKNMDFEDAHNLSDKIEYDIYDKLSINLTIHLDPIDTDSEKLIEVRDGVSKLLQSKYTNMSAHDFRIVEVGSKSNVIFDLEVPHRIDNSTINKVKNELNDLVTSISKDYSLILNIDSSYIS